MNAQDLMIGNWVLFDGWTFKVIGLEKHDVRLDGHLFQSYEEIEPVPLTDEILQKHFPDTTDGVIWHPTNNPGKYEIIIPHKTDRGETSCYINYVHELQQILKICGIKKDIEL